MLLSCISYKYALKKAKLPKNAKNNSKNEKVMNKAKINVR